MKCFFISPRWTYTGQPLVRATPFSQTRRQQRQGRAWFSPRPQRFERAFYPPRPYKRTTTPLVMNLCNGHLGRERPHFPDTFRPGAWHALLASEGARGAH
jgi:hypothetical protein